MFGERLHNCVRMVSECFDLGAVPIHWPGAFIVPCTKGRVASMNVVTREVLVC